MYGWRSHVVWSTYLIKLKQSKNKLLNTHNVWCAALKKRRSDFQQHPRFDFQPPTPKLCYCPPTPTPQERRSSLKPPWNCNHKLSITVQLHHHSTWTWTHVKGFRAYLCNTPPARVTPELLNENTGFVNCTTTGRRRSRVCAREFVLNRTSGESTSAKKQSWVSDFEFHAKSLSLETHGERVLALVSMSLHSRNLFQMHDPGFSFLQH